MGILNFLLFLFLGFMISACTYVAGGDQNQETPLTLNALDVGQGLAILFEYDGRFALYDAGPDSVGILDSIKARGVDSLEWVVLSHNHRDHVGGFFELAGNVPIKQLLVGPDTVASSMRDSVLQLAWLKSIPVDTLWRGDFLNMSGKSAFAVDGGPTFDVLWPTEYFKVGDNEASIVIRLSYGESSCLLVGDLDSIGERKLLGLSPDLSANLLQVGHHGSSGSSSLKFLTTISPDYALISVGRKNSYGHPKSQVLNKLSLILGDTSHIYRTDLLGSLNFRLYVNLGVLVE